MEPRRYYGHFLGAPGKNDDTFSCNETLVNKLSKCFRPIGDRGSTVLENKQFMFPAKVSYSGFL